MATQTPLLGLQLHQCSLHTETPAWAKGAPAQIEASLQRGALAVGYTEAGAHALDVPAFHALCAQYDYALYQGHGDTAIAWDTHFALVDKGEVTTAPNHALRWITLDYHGERVTVVEQHWMTRHTGNEPKRETQSRFISEVVKSHAARSDLCFWMGDTNSAFQKKDDPTRVALKGAGLVSSCEAVGTYPHTLGGATCDVIGHYARDTRVKCLAVETYDPLGSDHVPVSAFYSIAQ